MYDNMTLQEAENAVIGEFSMYDEWLDKYEYLIELGKNLGEYPQSAKTDDKLIKGCQSRVWLDYYIQDAANHNVFVIPPDKSKSGMFEVIE